jgi:hypothetical protein
MHPRRALAALFMMIWGVLMTAPSPAEMRFNLRGHVSAICQIERQEAAADGSSTLVELEILCNLPAFSLAAPGARNMALGEYQLLGRTADAPVITENEAEIDFANFSTGRHLIRLRIQTRSRSTRLMLDAI